MRFCSTDVIERIGYDFYCDIANNIVKGREEPVAADLIQLDFRVFGTREQIMALRNYMIENQIKFGKVE